jgi:hypothetical protein
MTLKLVEKSKGEKISPEKADIRYLQDYKKSHKKLIAKISSKISLERAAILLGILRKRQEFNEIKTIRAVENCRKLVFGELESFFAQKEKTISTCLPELISKSSSSYARIFNDRDLEEILSQTQNTILNELSERFNSSIVWQFNNAHGDGLSDIFHQIQKYQQLKKRTVLITSYLETLARRTLGNSIESLMKNCVLAQLACDFDISTILLPELGINSDLETRELNQEVLRRIGGALHSIKVNLTQDLNRQIANIFYQTHDLQLDSVLGHKIHLLEEKINLTIQETNLLEA